MYIINGNGSVSSCLPFVFIVIIALMVVAVTDSAPQEADYVSSPEYLGLERVLHSTEEEMSTKLEVEVQSTSQVLLSWDDSLVNETDVKYEIELETLADSSIDGKIVKKNLTAYDNQFTLRDLEPGRSYRVRIFLRDNFLPLETNFTTKPNCPDRFVVWFRNETSLMIYWQPPSLGMFESYRAEISPRKGGTNSTVRISKEDYQTGELTPGFYNLTPGRAYNISVMTLSGGMVSTPLIKEYRTIPLKPENVTVSILELKNRPSTITVQWLPPPLDQGDYDGFNVYINHKDSKPMQKFVSKTKPSRAHLEDPLLEIGGLYEVIVKTVSGKISSPPVSHNFTFIPSKTIN